MINWRMPFPALPSLVTKLSPVNSGHWVGLPWVPGVGRKKLIWKGRRNSDGNPELVSLKTQRLFMNLVWGGVSRGRPLQPQHLPLFASAEIGADLHLADLFVSITLESKCLDGGRTPCRGNRVSNSRAVGWTAKSDPETRRGQRHSGPEQIPVSWRGWNQREGRRQEWCRGGVSPLFPPSSPLPYHSWSCARYFTRVS